MSELSDRLRGLEAQRSPRPNATVLDTISASVSRRARRRRVVRRLEVGAAVAAAVVLGATAGWSLTHHDDPIAPEPSTTESVAPAPMPSASAVDSPYEIVDGVTVSPYLPAALPATQDVWDRVGSGWILAEFEGGLFEPGRGLDLGGPAGTFRSTATTGPRIAYLVSPEGEVFEAANLTDLGVDNILGWSVDRGTAVVSAGKAPQTPFDEPIYVLDLEAGTLSSPVTPCPDGFGTSTADPVEGGWRIAADCSGADGLGLEIFINDDGREMESPWAPQRFPGDRYYYVVAGGDMLEMLEGSLADDGDVLVESRLRVIAPGGSPREITLPAAPDGGDSTWCSPYVSGGDVLLGCYAVVGTLDSDIYTPFLYLATVDTSTATTAPLLDWFTHETFTNEGASGWASQCVVNAKVYGAWSTPETHGTSETWGLWRWDGTGPTRLSRPSEVDQELACVGRAGDQLIVRGSGPLFSFDPGSQTWRTLLPVVSVPDDETGPRYVAGVRALPVFIAP